MASNQLPTTSSQLIDLGTNMEAGLVQYGSDLKITQITPAGFQSDLSAFIVQDNSYNAARSSRQTVSDTNQAAMLSIANWLLVAKNVLMGRFGNRWSTEWAQAGFISPSIAIPQNAADQLGLALRLVGFFTANPGYEVASMNVTAAQGTILRNAAVSAQQALAAAVVALNNVSITWQAAYEKLTGTMRALIKILAASMSGTDPRWNAFGLYQPDASTTPGKPVNVTAHLDGNGNIVVQCEAVALATRYRWRTMRLGIDTDYQLAARSVDPVGLISSVLPGQTAQIIVQAVNGPLQGVASEPIQFAMPQVGASVATATPVTATVEPVLDLAPLISANGANGRNGHHTPLVSTRA